MESVVYILVKNGEYNCLSDSTSTANIKQMEKLGWKHTATINAAVWLKCYLNGDELARSRQIADVSNSPA